MKSLKKYEGYTAKICYKLIIYALSLRCTLFQIYLKVLMDGVTINALYLFIYIEIDITH